MAEIATFRVYPGLGNFEHNTGRRGLYFDVRVFSTLLELRATSADGAPAPKRYFRRAKGVCQKWREPYRRFCGQILLYRKELGGSVVSHECTHAAIFWFKRLKGLDHSADLRITSTR